MEIPMALKRLVRMIMRGFYSIDHIILVDMLIRKPCMKEDELVDLLKFERKYLRAIIAQLKSDKMLKSRLRMETGPDNKTTRQNYYYISYKAFVNVVKYKLDHMRRKIETEERDSTSRASFVCTNCKKTFTDLEADQLWDMTTGEFRCSYCNDLVDEDPNVMPRPDSRLMLAKFNEQIAPIYTLLREVEDIKLPADLLEPEISDVVTSNNSNHSMKNEIIPSTSTASGEDVFNSAKWREQEKNKTANNNYDAMMANESSMSVKIENVAESVATTDFTKRIDATADGVKKEQPAWMTESTVYDSNVSMKLPSSTSAANISTVVKKEPDDNLLSCNLLTTSGVGNHSNHYSNHNHHNVGSTKEILEALLVHEKHEENSNCAISSLLQSGDYFGEVEQNHDVSHHNGFHHADDNDELMDSEDDDQMHDQTPLVKVGNELIPLSDIDNDHIHEMTGSEKDNYIRLTQQVYSHLYD